LYRKQIKNQLETELSHRYINISTPDIWARRTALLLHNVLKLPIQIQTKIRQTTRHLYVQE